MDQIHHCIWPWSPRRSAIQAPLRISRQGRHARCSTYLKATLGCVGPLIGGVLQFDRVRVGDHQVNIDLATWGLEERKEYQVHFELLRDALMDKVVAIDSDLVRGIISEMEGDGGDG